MDSSSIQATHILGLNDDCLRAIFSFLELSDFSVVADVCYRFRSIAKAQFHGLTSGKLLLHKIYLRGETVAQSLQRTARCLRNFGAFIVSIDAIICNRYFDSMNRDGNAIRIIELICDYCHQTLTELRLHQFRYRSKDDRNKDFIDYMSKMRRIQILEMEWTPSLFIHQLVQICGNLVELTDLNLEKSTAPIDGDDLVQLLQSTPKLRFFRYKQFMRGTYIDRDRDGEKLPFWHGLFITQRIFEKLLEMQEHRRVHLTIILYNGYTGYGAGYRRRIPEELARAHDDILTVIHRDSRYIRRNNISIGCGFSESQESLKFLTTK